VTLYIKQEDSVSLKTTEFSAVTLYI